MSDYPKKQCTECGDWYEREAIFSKDPNSGIRISICNGCELKMHLKKFFKWIFGI